MRLSLTSLSSLLLVLPLLGCPPGEDEDKVDDTAPADTDTDTDSDTDADTDADVAPAYSFAGSVTVNSTRDGEVVCDAEATLTGTPYTGECEGCDFAVDIVDEVTTDNSAYNCSYYPKYSFIEAGGYYDLLMASTATYAGYYYDYTNAFLLGYSVTVDYYGYTYDYPGPYFAAMAYDGSSYTSWTRSGDDVSWSLSYAGSYDDYDTTEYNACSEVATSSATEGFDGTGGTSTVDCKAEQSDVWTFDAGGGEVTITIDTTGDDSAFDPRAWVNDPDGCTVEYADDSWECSYPPPKYECPSFDLSTTTPGTYTVVVRSYGSCAGTEGEYELRVGGDATNVVLSQDDVTASVAVTREITIDVAGSGTLTAE